MRARLLLEHAGVSALFTKEPTPNFRLDNEQQHSGYRLAELLTADRAAHLADTVLPALKTHDIVVTDRYIASSLVFQVVDGVSFSQVWALNRRFPLPDLNIFLLADIPSLLRRRRLRASHTRLEQTDPQIESDFYREASEFMEKQGTQTVHIDNSDSSSEDDTAHAISRAILDVTRSDDA